MKYLKTYEDYRDDITSIELWMIDHNLDSVDLNLNGKCKWFDCLLTKVFLKNHDFGYVKYIRCDLAKCTKNLEQEFETPLETEDPYWTDQTIKGILDYLESLTPVQIEDQRANNEAEKFNM